MAIGRRVLITGATIVGLGAAAGIVAFRAGEVGERTGQAFLDAVADDYRNGRVVVVAGWIMSETEAAAFDSDPPTTSSAPDAT